MKKFKEELQKALNTFHTKQLSESIKRGIKEAKKRKNR